MAKSARKRLKSDSGAADIAAPPDVVNEVVRRGETNNFGLFYQATLADQGIHIADVLLQTCEAQYQTLKEWFAGIVHGSLPFHVTVTDSAKGASHPRCASTQIQVRANSRTRAGGPDCIRNLLRSEVAEVFMASQA